MLHENYVTDFLSTVRECVPESVPESVSESVPESVSESVPESVSESVSETVSDCATNWAEICAPNIHKQSADMRPEMSRSVDPLVASGWDKMCQI